MPLPGGGDGTRRGTMETTETREQTMTKIEFHLPSLTDAQLRLVAAFIKGIKRKE